MKVFGPVVVVYKCYPVLQSKFLQEEDKNLHRSVIGYMLVTFDY